MNLAELKEQKLAPEWLTEEGLTTLQNGYLLDGESPKDMWKRVCDAAASRLKKPELADKFFELFWNNWLCGATPVLSNMGTTRGLPISCLVGETWVNTKHSGKQIKDIEIGDEVLTHEGRYKKVIDKKSRMSSGDLFKLVVATRTTPIKITGNHPVLTNLGWVRVDELDPKVHFIATNKDIEFEEKEYQIDMVNYVDYSFIEENNKIIKKSDNKIKRKNTGTVSYYAKVNRKIDVDDDLAWALGIWIAEGSKSTSSLKKPNGARITLNVDEKYLAEKWLKIISEKFNVNGNMYESSYQRDNFAKGKVCKWLSCSVNSKAIGNFFVKEFGLNCKVKTIPQWILDLPKDKLKTFLYGVLEGDGSFAKAVGDRDKWSISLANPKLLLGLYNICLKLGIDCSLQMQSKPSNIGKTKYVYTLRSIVSDSVKLSKFNSVTGIQFGKLRYCPILSLDKLKENQEVFDITVAEDHSFSAEGVVVHNCNSIHVGDSIRSIFEKQTELAILSKNGAGVGIYVGDVRGRGTSISGNGRSEGVIPWLKCYDSTTVAVSQGCYDDQTDILTDKGWIPFKDLTNYKVKVAQVNNNKIEFVDYSDYIEYHTNEDLYSFSNKDKSVNIMVTGNHNMVIEKKKRASNKRKSNNKFISNKKYYTGKLELVSADQLKMHNDNRFLLTCPISKQDNKSLSVKDKIALAYQADGSSNPSGNSNGKISNKLIYDFHFSKQRKIDRLTSFFDEVGYEYTLSVQKDKTTKISVKFPINEVPSKLLSDSFNLSSFSESTAKEFIKEIGCWDGSTGKTFVQYFSTEEQNVDFVQAVATLAGFMTNKKKSVRENRKDISILYISLNRNSAGGEHIKKTKVPYNGKVYCVTVPSNIIVVRRSGRTLVCGNSVRRGASAVYLPVDHSDIEEFINVRRPVGDVNRRCLNLHHAVCIKDDFMQKVRDGGEHERYLWKEILKARFETGEPYLFFSDNVDRQKPDCYKKNNLDIKTSNICVTGDQRVVTSKGIKTVIDLYNSKESLELFDGENTVKASPMMLIEKNAEVFKITTHEGRTHSVTPYHKVLTDKGLVECKDLKVGDKVVIQRKEGLFGNVAMQEMAHSFGQNYNLIDEKTENNLNKIPQWLWDGDKDTHSSFFKGLFYKSDVVKNQSLEFLRDIQIILSNLGIATKINNKQSFYELSLLKDFEQNKFDTIESIEQIENQDVYCTTVSSNEHVWTCNSFITSNCNEIYLYTDPEHTFVCCLSSMNLFKYHEWKNTNAVQLSIWFLDAVIQEYVEKAKGVNGLESAVRFAEKSRALGLGVLGWHSLLQKNKIPFDSFEAMRLNAEIFKHMQKESQIATKELAKEYGEPEWCKGFGIRNTHQLAVAPTVSNSIISGSVSAGIEPISANVVALKTGKGTFMRSNPILKELLAEKNMDNIDVWKQINENSGSVADLKFLSSSEKEVFLTAREINQHAIIKQAGQRQKYIDQGQSINLFFAKNSDPKYIHSVHMLAWEEGLKGLYYCRSEAALKGDSVNRQKEECKACEG